jgi:hypothetical protein
MFVDGKPPPSSTHGKYFYQKKKEMELILLWF